MSKWKTSAPWKAQIMLEVLHATDLFDALQKLRINYMQGVSIASKNLQNKENINNLPVIIEFKHKTLTAGCYLDNNVKASTEIDFWKISTH